MVVNSISFWIFFIILLVPYWLFGKVNNSKCQNLVLLLFSYIFYAIASIKMCLLLASVTGVFFGLGLLIEKNNKSNPYKAAVVTKVGVCVGIALLAYYKFLDFFILEFSELLNDLGLHANIRSLGIIMPIGISFFTFKLISYVLEVHRGNMHATRNIIDFGVYVAYFPTILSGPIDRPKEFMFQLQESRVPTYNTLANGLKHVVWGMFLKMCIADRLSDYTDPVFLNYEMHNGTSLLIAMFLYTFKMYTDFSGYTEMAIGVSHILGVQIRQNFYRPFFSQNMAEYWRRWHMSLTTWLTDYVFMPLCILFRDYGKLGLYLATVINLVVVGFWHGANWTYGLFGLYHGLLLVIVTIFEKKKKKIEKKYQLKNKWSYRLPNILITFLFVSFGLLIFQSPSVSVWAEEFRKILFEQDINNIYLGSKRELIYTLLFITLLMSKEFMEEFYPKICNKLFEYKPIRWFLFYIICFSILLFGLTSEGKFIYVQF